MKQYNRYFKEKEEDDSVDERVTEILEFLRDKSFGNESARKELLDYLTTLHNSSDKRGRMAFKRIGELFSEIGDELIKYGDKE